MIVCGSGNGVAIVAQGAASPSYNMRSAHRDVQAAYKRLVIFSPT